MNSAAPALKERKQELGIYYTSEVIVDLIYSMLNVLKEKEDKETKRWESRKPAPHYPSVIDPACGEGIFLKKAIESGFTGEHPKYKIPYVFGMDIDETVVKQWEALSILKLFHGNRKAMSNHFYAQNGLLTLPDRKLPYKKFKDGLMQFDAVVGNPPYGGIGVDFKGKLTAENRTLLETLENFEIFTYRKTKFTYGDNEKKTGQEDLFAVHEAAPKLQISRTELIKLAQGAPIEVLFVERFIQLAKPGGWIAIIVPEGILSNSNMQYVREYMARKTKVHAIVSLPRTAFKRAGTSAKTSFLILQKFRPEDSRSLEYPVFLCASQTIEVKFLNEIPKSFRRFINHGTV